jgi:hypothetical protein
MIYKIRRNLAAILASITLAFPVAVSAQTVTLPGGGGAVNQVLPATIVPGRALPSGLTIKANAVLSVYSLAQMDPVTKELPFVKNVTADANGFFDVAALPKGQNHIIYTNGIQRATWGQLALVFTPGKFSRLPTMQGRVVSAGSDVKVVLCEPISLWACK